MEPVVGNIQAVKSARQLRLCSGSNLIDALNVETECIVETSVDFRVAQVTDPHYFRGSNFSKTKTLVVLFLNRLEGVGCFR